MDGPGWPNCRPQSPYKHSEGHWGKNLPRDEELVPQKTQISIADSKDEANYADYPALHLASHCTLVREYMGQQNMALGIWTCRENTLPTISSMLDYYLLETKT
jgi:hypothetical protein